MSFACKVKYKFSLSRLKNGKRPTEQLQHDQSFYCKKTTELIPEDFT